LWRYKLNQVCDILISLRITEEYALEEPAIPKTKEMLTVPAPAVYNGTEQTFMPKSMVLDPE